MIMAIKQAVASVAVNQALAYLEKDPERNIEKLLNWIDAFDRRGRIDKHMKAARPALTDPDSNWRKLVLKMYSDIDKDVRMTIFRNFVVNATIIGGDMPEHLLHRDKM